MKYLFVLAICLTSVQALAEKGKRAIFCKYLKTVNGAKINLCHNGDKQWESPATIVSPVEPATGAVKFDLDDWN